jgi:hypothetical protein
VSTPVVGVRSAAGHPSGPQPSPRTPALVTDTSLVRCAGHQPPGRRSFRKRRTVNPPIAPARYDFLYSSSRPALRAAACGGRPRAGSDTTVTVEPALPSHMGYLTGPSGLEPRVPARWREGEMMFRERSELNFQYWEPAQPNRRHCLPDGDARCGRCGDPFSPFDPMTWVRRNDPDRQPRFHIDCATARHDGGGLT